MARQSLILWRELAKEIARERTLLENTPDCVRPVPRGGQRDHLMAMDELAQRRADALGQYVLVIGFTGAGTAQMSDVEGDHLLAQATVA